MFFLNLFWCQVLRTIYLSLPSNKQHNLFLVSPLSILQHKVEMPFQSTLSFFISFCTSLILKEACSIGPYIQCLYLKSLIRDPLTDSDIKRQGALFAASVSDSALKRKNLMFHRS